VTLPRRQVEIEAARDEIGAGAVISRRAHEIGEADSAAAMHSDPDSRKSP